MVKSSDSSLFITSNFGHRLSKFIGNLEKRENYVDCGVAMAAFQRTYAEIQERKQSVGTW